MSPYYLYEYTQSAQIVERIEENCECYVYHLWSQCQTQGLKNIEGISQYMPRQYITNTPPPATKAWGVNKLHSAPKILSTQGVGLRQEVKACRLSTDTVPFKRRTTYWWRYSSFTTPCLCNDQLQPSERTSQISVACGSFPSTGSNELGNPFSTFCSTYSYAQERKAFNSIQCLYLNNFFPQKPEDLHTLLAPILTSPWYLLTTQYQISWKTIMLSGIHKQQNVQSKFSFHLASLFTIYI